MSAIRYETVIFLQGDDYQQFEAELYPDASAEDLHQGMLLGWKDHKAAFAHLLQWEDGEGRPWHSTPPWGDGDDTIGFTRKGAFSPVRDVRRMRSGYVMSWHTGLSYASLTRVAPADPA